MSKTIRIKLYKFDELKPAAQQKAIQDYRESQQRTGDYAWIEENRDTLKAFCALFSVNTNRGIDNYRFDLAEQVRELSGQRLATYLWNNYHTDLYKPLYLHKSGIKRFRYSRITVTTDCVLTGYTADSDILKPIYDYMTKPDNRTFRDLIGDCLQSWSRAVDEEIEWQDREEYIINEIVTNEYYFTKDGKQY